MTSAPTPAQVLELAPVHALAATTAVELAREMIKPYSATVLKGPSNPNPNIANHPAQALGPSDAWATNRLVQHHRIERASDGGSFFQIDFAPVPFVEEALEHRLFDVVHDALMHDAPIEPAAWSALVLSTVNRWTDQMPWGKVLRRVRAPSVPWDDPLDERAALGAQPSWELDALLDTHRKRVSAYVSTVKKKTTASANDPNRQKQLDAIAVLRTELDRITSDVDRLIGQAPTIDEVLDCLTAPLTAALARLRARYPGTTPRPVGEHIAVAPASVRSVAADGDSIDPVGAPRRGRVQTGRP